MLTSLFFVAVIVVFSCSSLTMPGFVGELNIKTDEAEEPQAEKEITEEPDSAYATPGASNETKPENNDNSEEAEKPENDAEANAEADAPATIPNEEPVVKPTGSRKIDPNKPMVALTFDDGPCKYTNDFLDLMEEYNVVCTFFEIGQNAARYPDEIKRERELGCELGNHSYTHPDLSSLSDAEAKSEIDRANNVFIDITGKPATLIRPPYGKIGDKSRLFNQPVVTWSVDTLDWSSRNADKVMNVIYDEGDLDGKVILMHSIHESSLEATKRLIPYLLEEGYQLVTVSDIYKYKHGTTMANGELYTYKSFQ